MTADNDDPSFTERAFEVCFGLIFGILLGVCALECTWNTFKKMWLFDEYELRGVDVPATLLYQKMQRDPDFPRSYHVKYTYPCFEQNRGIIQCDTTRQYRKEYVQVIRMCRSEPHLSMSFTVKVLPEYPKSGVPKEFVDRGRNRRSNVLISVVLVLEVMCFLYLCSGILLLGVVDFEKDPPLLMDLEVSLLFIAIGYPLASMWFLKWKRKVLEEATELQIPSFIYQRVATTAEPAREDFSAIHADAHVVESDRLSYGSLDFSPPLVAATEIHSDHHGIDCEAPMAKVIDVEEGFYNT